MATINRSDVIQKAVIGLGLSTANDKIPNETLDKVQETFSLNYQFSNFVVNSSATTTGTITATSPTVSTGGEIYITGIQAAYVKDATCDQATGVLNINLTPDALGISKTVAYFPVITLTAQQDSLSYTFPYPLKIKSGTSVTFTGSFSVGVMSRGLSVTGFTTSSF